ncbi:MAG: NAD(P)-dependent oxidoreductase [Candidatus Aminicenantes bacterium]|jgi:UDP-glucose 4-epimerase
MKSLITGASGFIGYRLSLQLAESFGINNVQLMVPPLDHHDKEKERRHKLMNLGFPLINHDILEDELDISKIKHFDVLFHLAAFTETETRSPGVHINDIGTERLLKSLSSLLPGKLVVHTGSLAGIDRKHRDNTPMDENYPCNPRTIYGKTKLKGEMILKDLAKQLGFEWVILRLPTVYGPGYRPGGMFTLISDSLKNGTLPSKLNWPGRMSVVYLEDVVQVLVSLGTKQAGVNTLYHMSSGEDPVFDDLINRIADVLEIKRRRMALPRFLWKLIRFVVWLPGLMSVLPFGLRNSLWRLSLIITDGLVANSSKINTVLSIKFTPLDQGLLATYNKNKILPRKCNDKNMEKHQNPGWPGE